VNPWSTDDYKIVPIVPHSRGTGGFRNRVAIFIQEDGGERALVHRSFVNGLAIGMRDRNQLDPSAMPYIHKSDHRHHIGKMKFKVTNWADYEAGLRRRGNLTLGITPEAVARWRAPRRKTRGVCRPSGPFRRAISRNTASAAYGVFATTRVLKSLNRRAARRLRLPRVGA